ncbi:MAG: ImmA/IrrE family metallo-endopeptidase [Thermoguttaceae bacterium]|jgi:HTH-type transcriptional regulator/antitoxin HigA
MVAKVIKNDREYEAALERIEALMDAARDTPEGDELELLTTLVEVYEDKHFPINLPDPIEAIRFRMQQAGLKQQDLVPFIGSRSKVSEILAGKRPLSLKMIRALHQQLGIPAEVLLREPGGKIPEELPNLQCERFPLKEMARRGWIAAQQQGASKLKDQAEELVRQFLRPLTVCGIKPGLLRPRQHVRSGSTMDEYALLAWCVRVIATAQQQSVADYHPANLAPEVMQRLVQLSYLDSGPLLAREFLGKNGIHLIVLRHLPRTHLDGAAMMLSSGKPVVALTLRYDRLDNFWFTLFHELGHVKLHFEKDKDACFFDDLDVDPEGLEVQADEFAQNSLISPMDWQSTSARHERTPHAVLQLAHALRVHPAIIAGRIRREQKNYRLLASLVGQHEARKHFPDAEKGDSG